MRPYRPESCREDVISTETWNGGTGTIAFNYLQQRPTDTTERLATPLEEAETTDPWNITD